MKLLKTVAQSALIILWGTQLFNCDSWYINYLMIFIAALFCFVANAKNENAIKKSLNKKNKITVAIFTLVFTGIITFSNIKMWDLKNLVILTLGGLSTFYNIFVYTVFNIKTFQWKEDENTANNSKKIFFVCLLILLLVRMLVLILCMWPGFISGDSVDQINQMLTGNYSDHHPVYHTQFMHFFINIGMSLFGGDINMGVAVFSIAQIIMTSAIMAFTVSTMAKMKAPKWLIITTIAFYALTPYHIMYSFTLWKNIAFSYSVLMFVLFIVRYFKNLGSETINIFGIGITGLLICLFQSNGFFIFVLLTAMFALIWRLKYKKVLVTLVIALFTGFFMKNVVLGWFNINPPDTIEALSIPTQQISRVIADGKELSDDEKALLGEVVDIDKIPDEYNNHISDPIKHLVRAKGNQEVLKEKKFEFIKLWATLGFKHPGTYIKAYIDQTEGYYNSGGYGVILWIYNVSPNNLGIKRTLNSEGFLNALDNYFNLFKEIEILKPLVSLGLFTWLYIFFLFIAIIKRDKLGIFISLPALFVVMSLMIATPTYAEFRYVYVSFLVLPLVACTVLRRKKGKND